VNGYLYIFNQTISYINLKNIVYVGEIALDESNLRCNNLSTYVTSYTSCINCGCANGYCLNNTSTCTSCYPNFFGIECQACSCDDDDCYDGINGNGTCLNCSNTNESCNYISVLSDNSTTVNFRHETIYIGTLNLISSNLTLVSTKLIILSNFTLNDTVVSLDFGSSIIVNKCLFLTDSTLHINLEGDKNSKSTLITFDPSCSKISNLKHSFYNTTSDSCPNLTVLSNSISVLLSNCNGNNSDNNSDNYSIWIILVVVFGSA